MLYNIDFDYANDLTWAHPSTLKTASEATHTACKAKWPAHKAGKTHCNTFVLSEEPQKMAILFPDILTDVYTSSEK
jgi:hypothetical protein